MATMTNIMVKDDAATPVEYTLLPITDNPIPFWRSAIANVPLDGQMRLYTSAVKQKNGSYKITAKLEVPVMETLGASGTSGGYVAPPKVAYVNTGIFTFFVDKRSTQADRSNLLRLITHAIVGASSTTATGLAPAVASGDVFKNSVLPLPYMFTGLVVPS